VKSFLYSKNGRSIDSKSEKKVNKKKIKNKINGGEKKKKKKKKK
jgi:hypothetical protein